MDLEKIIKEAVREVISENEDEINWESAKMGFNSLKKDLNNALKKIEQGILKKNPDTVSSGLAAVFGEGELNDAWYDFVDSGIIEDEDEDEEM